MATAHPAPAGTIPGDASMRTTAPLLIVSLSLLLATMALYLFGVVQEAAKAEMALSDLGLSLVQGAAVAIPLALFSIPLGMLADRANRVRILMGTTLLWSAASLGTAFSHSLATLFVSRLLVATAATAVGSTGFSLAADLCRPAHRGRNMLIANIGKVSGSAAIFACGATLFGYLVRNGVPSWMGALSPWRAVHLTMALAGMGLLAALTMMREPARQERVLEGGAPVKLLLREWWSRRRFMVPLLGGQVGIVMADAAAAVWAVPILSRNYGLHPQDVAGSMSLIVLGTGVVGSLVGGYAADLGHNSRLKGGIMLAAVIASIVSIPAALFPLMPSFAGFAFGLTVLLFCGTVASLSLMAVIGIHLPNELRGLTFGAFLAAAGLIGFGITPTLVALLARSLGGDAKLGAALAIVGLVVSLLASAASALAMRRVPASGTAGADGVACPA